MRLAKKYFHLKSNAVYNSSAKNWYFAWNLKNLKLVQCDTERYAISLEINHFYWNSWFSSETVQTVELYIGKIGIFHINL